MEIKRVLRIILIFVVLYLITGFIYPYVLNATIGGVHSIFEEFTINKSDALLALFVWPAVFLLIAGMGGGIFWLLIPLILILLLGGLAYYIDKKLFSKEEELQPHSQNKKF